MIGEMHDTQELKQLYASKGFGNRIGFGDKPAILVIDLIGAFTNEGTPLGAKLQDVVKQTRMVLEHARRVHVPVIFTTVAYRRDLKDAGLWAKKAPVGLLIEGTQQVEVDPLLGRLPEEPVIVKKYASAFFGTDLVSRLNAERVDTLILTGCTTSGCVRATAVDGISYGFRIIVVEEAVGDRAELSHRVSLADIDAKYGDVVSVDSVLNYLTSKAQSH